MIARIVWFYEADKGENINTFAKKAAERYKGISREGFVLFNGIYIPLEQGMDAEDIVKKYYTLRREQ